MAYSFKPCNGEHFLYISTCVKEILCHILSLICFNNFRHKITVLPVLTSLFSQAALTKSLFWGKHKISQALKCFQWWLESIQFPYSIQLNYSSHKHCKGHFEYIEAWQKSTWWKYAHKYLFVRPVEQLVATNFAEQVSLSSLRW